MNDVESLSFATGRDDPYPVYHRLRAADPVHWDAALGGWVCTRYADVQAALRDRRLSNARRPPVRDPRQADAAQLAPLDRCWTSWMIFKEPPEHGRLRTVANKGFAGGCIEALRPLIQRNLDDLLDALPASGEAVDVMPALAGPLPNRTIGEMMGVAPADVSRMSAWAADLVEAFGSGRPTARAADSYEQMRRYFARVLADGASTGRQPLIHALMQAVGDGSVSEDEFLANCAFLLVAGRDTTTNLIGNSIFTLLRHPEAFELLRADASLAGTAVEELLRYESPVQYVSRTALEDLEIGGRRIAQGQVVVLCLGAANRDPATFAQPDRLDLARQPNPHLAFISGVHFCLGAPLARLEGRLVLAALAQRFRAIVPAAIEAEAEVETEAETQNGASADVSTASVADVASVASAPGTANGGIAANAAKAVSAADDGAPVRWERKSSIRALARLRVRLLR